MAASNRKERLSFAVSDSQGKPLGACPQCGGVLEEGIVAIHGTWWSGLFVGWSYENLWFRPHGGQKTPALQSGESRRGWRCVDCGFVGVAAPGRDAGLPGYKYFRS